MTQIILGHVTLATEENIDQVFRMISYCRLSTKLITDDCYRIFKQGRIVKTTYFDSPEYLIESASAEFISFEWAEVLQAGDTENYLLIGHYGTVEAYYLVNFTGGEIKSIKQFQ